MSEQEIKLAELRQELGSKDMEVVYYPTRSVD